MRAEDMPKELLERIRAEFEASPPVVKLRLRQRDLQTRGCYMEALKQAREIEETFNNVVFKYMKETEKSIEKVDVGKMSIPPEDKEKMLTLCTVMFMACDLIDFAVMDANDILHKHDKELSFEMFNDIRGISTLAKQKLKYLQEKSNYMEGLVWADRCDDMYDMIRNKARAIIKSKKANC